MSVCRSQGLRMLRLATSCNKPRVPTHWLRGNVSPRNIIWKPSIFSRVCKRTYSTPGDVQPTITTKDGKSSLCFEWNDGAIVELSAFYLRDHCHCKECRHEETKQRLLDTFSIPRDLFATRLLEDRDGVSMTWSNDGHESFFSWQWLNALANGLHSLKWPKHIYWGAEIKKDPPVASYDEIMNSDEGVKHWTALLQSYGFSYIDGCPVTTSATKSLLERIAFIKPTHYGGFWDFTSDLSLKDTAYTSLALGAHTDTTYFSEPAGLQMFHLLSHTEGKGGASLLVDGFRAASILKQKFPEAFNILSTFNISSHASGNDGIHLRPEFGRPVLNLASSGASLLEQTLYQVRWNNDDRAVLPANIASRQSEVSVDAWYDAARKWVDILRSAESEYWEQLRPGRALIFDNWRVLHGRSAFTGKRRMCGGYINHDDFMSRWRTLNMSPDELSLTV